MAWALWAGQGHGRIMSLDYKGGGGGPSSCSAWGAHGAGHLAHLHTGLETGGLRGWVCGRKACWFCKAQKAAVFGAPLWPHA